MALGQHAETVRAEHELRRIARRNGIDFNVTSRFRSIGKQTELFELRRRRPDLQRFPVAVPGTSTHNFGLAFDAVTRNPDDQARLGALARGAGLVWAGPGDPIHFQVATQADWSAAITRSGLRDAIRTRFGPVV